MESLRFTQTRQIFRPNIECDVCMRFFCCTKNKKLLCWIYFNMNINKFLLSRSYAFDWKHRFIHTVALFMLEPINREINVDMKTHSEGNKRILNVMNHDDVSFFLISHQKFMKIIRDFHNAQTD